MKISMQFAEHILDFVANLQFPALLPPGVEVMNPFQGKETMEACRQFYTRYYSDESPRWMMIGINPGRFGAGVTGIPFTDPIRLEDVCGIRNNWPKKQELSSVFMYAMMKAFGGAEAFYQQFYITSVSPLGFTRHNKNLNYYDDRQLQNSIREFSIDCFERQLRFGIHRQAAFCLGEGKNFGYLSALNRDLKFFDHIVPLSHPRFIMQYKLKSRDIYIDDYLQKFDAWCKTDLI